MYHIVSSIGFGKCHSFCLECPPPSSHTPLSDSPDEPSTSKTQMKCSPLCSALVTHPSLGRAGGGSRSRDRREAPVDPTSCDPRGAPLPSHGGGLKTRVLHAPGPHTGEITELPPSLPWRLPGTGYSLVNFSQQAGRRPRDETRKTSSRFFFLFPVVKS